MEDRHSGLAAAAMVMDAHAIVVGFYFPAAFAIAFLWGCVSFALLFGQLVKAWSVTAGIAGTLLITPLFIELNAPASGEMTGIYGLGWLPSLVAALLLLNYVGRPGIRQGGTLERMLDGLRATATSRHGGSRFSARETFVSNMIESAAPIDESYPMSQPASNSASTLLPRAS